MARRACPWCAERIRAEARKCKHCGELVAAASPVDEAAASAGRSTSNPDELHVAQVGRRAAMGPRWALAAGAGLLLMALVGIALWGSQPEELSESEERLRRISSKCDVEEAEIEYLGYSDFMAGVTVPYPGGNGPAIQPEWRYRGPEGRTMTINAKDYVDCERVNCVVNPAHEDCNRPTLRDVLEKRIEARRTERQDQAIPDPPPATTEPPSDDRSSQRAEEPATGVETALAQSLDGRLDEDWEIYFFDYLDHTEPVAADAFVVGTLWAVADYCLGTTPMDRASCHDAAARYYEHRYEADLSQLFAGMESLGAIGSFFDDGYNTAAPYLGLPPATLETQDDRPSFAD